MISERKTERIPALDWLKALAIVAVVVNHAGPFLGFRAAGVEAVVRHSVVQFHVPVFLFVAGFLTFRRSLDVWFLIARVGRVVIPYLVASIVAIALGHARVATAYELASILLTGGALQIYYFVFVLVAMLCITILSAMACRWAPVALLVVLLLYSFGCMEGFPCHSAHSVYWTMRDPTRSGGYFLLGWAVRDQWGSLAPLLRRYERYLLAPALLVVALVPWLTVPVSVVGARRLAYTMAVLGVVAALSPQSSAHRVVVFLSTNTFPVYLYHWFFVAPLLSLTLAWPIAARLLFLTSVGILGGLSLSAIARRLLGSRSRLILGA